jgi:hypothetical protein
MYSYAVSSPSTRIPLITKTNKEGFCFGSARVFRLTSLSEIDSDNFQRICCGTEMKFWHTLEKHYARDTAPMLTYYISWLQWLNSPHRRTLLPPHSSFQVNRIGRVSSVNVWKHSQQGPHKTHLSHSILNFSYVSILEDSTLAFWSIEGWRAPNHIDSSKSDLFSTNTRQKIMLTLSFVHSFRGRLCATQINWMRR